MSGQPLFCTVFHRKKHASCVKVQLYLQAAVCVMDSWISDPLMQNIAKENNFSETAFAVKEEALGLRPLEAYIDRDLLLVLKSADE
jgi:hypothetical protein